VSDQGGVAAECFAVAFDAIRSLLFETNGDGGGRSGSGRAVGLRSDLDLFAVDIGTADTDTAQKNNNPHHHHHHHHQKKQRTMTTLEGAGSLILWALLQVDDNAVELFSCSLFCPDLTLNLSKSFIHSTHHLNICLLSSFFLFPSPH
jgi:hypothetical protein